MKHAKEPLRRLWNFGDEYFGIFCNYLNFISYTRQKSRKILQRRDELHQLVFHQFCDYDFGNWSLEVLWPLGKLYQKSSRTKLIAKSANANSKV